MKKGENRIKLNGGLTTWNLQNLPSQMSLPILVSEFPELVAEADVLGLVPIAILLCTPEAYRRENVDMMKL